MLSLILEKKGPIRSMDNLRQTILHYAASLQDSSLLVKLLQSNIIDCSRDAQNKTPFDIAVQSNSIRCAEAIAPYIGIKEVINSSKNAVSNQFKEFFSKVKNSKQLPNSCFCYSIDHQKSISSNPLTIAIDQGSANTVSNLLKKGANPRIPFGRTAFAAAVFSRSVEIIDIIISTLSSPDELDCEGNSMIHYASSNKYFNSQILIHLLSKGCSLGSKNFDGFSAMDKIVSSGLTDALACIVREGFKIKGNNYSAVDSAIESNNGKMLKFLKEQGQTFSLEDLKKAIFGRDCFDDTTDDIILSLREKEFKKTFSSALAISAEFGSEDFSSILKEAVEKEKHLSMFFCLLMGANPSTSVRSKTLLDIASDKSDGTAVHLLLFFGASPDASLSFKPEEVPLIQELRRDGKILRIAAKFCPIQTLQFLIQNGSDIDFIGDGGRSIFEDAIKWMRIDSALVLAEYEAKTRPRGFDCPTLLHDMARNCFFSTENNEKVKKLISYLIGKGDSMLERDRNGNSALDIAKTFENDAMISVLEAQKGKME